MKLSNINQALGLFAMTAMVGLSFAMAPAAEAQEYMLNEVKSVKVYECTESITKANMREGAWNPSLNDIESPDSRVRLVDFGNAFLVMHKTADTLAVSGDLTELINDYLTGQPEPGITMGKGQGRFKGTYMYIGPNYLISWDCRL